MNNSSKAEKKKGKVHDNDGVESVYVPSMKKNFSENKSSKTKANRFKRLKDWSVKKKLVFAVGGLILLSFLILLVLFSNLYVKGVKLKTNFDSLIITAKTKDVGKIKTELDKTSVSYENFQGAYNTISWLKIFPYLGKYVKDAGYALSAGSYLMESGTVVLSSIEKEMDFSNESSNLSGEEKLKIIITGIANNDSNLDKITELFTNANYELSNIDANDYPEKILNKSVRDHVQAAINLTDLSTELFTKGKGLFKVAPYILGLDEKRKYLILFQNDKELRPTGGFMTAYSIAEVENASFKPVVSNDMYELDNSYNPRLPAPEPVKKYLKGPYLLSDNLRLRDMNWDPDFEESMRLFVDELETVGIENIDGVIAVDTHLLVNILDVVGPITVQGYGEFSTKIVDECDCPQVIYELESFADLEGPIVWSENEPGKIVYAPPNYDNRKKIIGPLMNSILANIFSVQSFKVPALFEAGMRSLTEKHILLYMKDAKTQAAIVDYGIGGKISEFEGDYLYINDANLGGRKSNLYLTKDIKQVIEIGEDKTIVKKLTITYKNNKEHDGWLNSVLPNYVRIYVPQGSELVEFSGAQETVEPYRQYEKEVFAGFFEVRPLGVVRLNIEYRLPKTITKENYKLLIQKQPGIDTRTHELTAGGYKHKFLLKKDIVFDEFSGWF